MDFYDEELVASVMPERTLAEIKAGCERTGKTPEQTEELIAKAARQAVLNKWERDGLVTIQHCRRLTNMAHTAVGPIITVCGNADATWTQEKYEFIETDIDNYPSRDMFAHLAMCVRIKGRAL